MNSTPAVLTKESLSEILGGEVTRVSSQLSDVAFSDEIVNLKDPLVVIERLKHVPIIKSPPPIDVIPMSQIIRKEISK